MIVLVAAVLLFAPAIAAGPSSGSSENDFAATVGSVSGDSMMTVVEGLEAFGSREFHLDSSRQAADYIYDNLVETGLQVDLQEFIVDGANVSNIVAVKQGSDPAAGCYLFGAHYDSENKYVDNLSEAENMTAPGADDDASGVAAVIELARLLSDHTLKNTVKFVAFGAEEYGYDDSGGSKGSEHFVAEEKEAGVAYDGTAILDMVGYRAGTQNRAVAVTNDIGDMMAVATIQAVTRYDIDLELTNTVQSRITYSDHSSFWSAGYPSMLVIEELSDAYVPVNPYYHTSSDVASTLSEDQMVAVTQALLGGVLQLAAADSSTGVSMLVAITLASAVCAVVIVTFVIHIKRRKERR